MSGADDDAPQALAAEYVLGTLDMAEAEAAQARLARDADFATEVRFWEARLFPLTTLVPAVPPPASLWTRIEDTTGGATRAPDVARPPSAANDNRLAWWRAATFLATAVAAALAFVVVSRPAAVQPELAVLAPPAGQAAIFLVVGQPDGALVLRAAAAGQGREGTDMELWALPEGATRPVSLGVLPPQGKRVPPGVKPGTKLLVSLEQKGGSPTGQPTGPVVLAGLWTGRD